MSISTLTKDSRLEIAEKAQPARSLTKAKALPQKSATRAPVSDTVQLSAAAQSLIQKTESPQSSGPETGFGGFGNEGGGAGTGGKTNAELGHVPEHTTESDYDATSDGRATFIAAEDPTHNVWVTKLQRQSVFQKTLTNNLEETGNIATALEKTADLGTYNDNPVYKSTVWADGELTSTNDSLQSDWEPGNGPINIVVLDGFEDGDTVGDKIHNGIDKFIEEAEEIYGEGNVNVEVFPINDEGHAEAQEWLEENPNPSLVWVASHGAYSEAKQGIIGADGQSILGTDMRDTINGWEQVLDGHSLLVVAPGCNSGSMVNHQ